MRVILAQDEVIFNAHSQMRRHIDHAHKAVFRKFDEMDAALGGGAPIRDVAVGDKIRAAMHNLIGSARLLGFRHASEVTGKHMPALYGRDIRINAEKRAEKVNSLMMRTTRMRYRTKPDSKFTFSEGRAMSAAKYEAARAYYRGVRDGFEGSNFDKRWITTSDGPCVECLDNEDDGYIPVDEQFASGDYYPLSHINCGCFITTRPARLESRAIKAIGNEWFEYHSNITPISSIHPPSLKNPIWVKIPMAQDGFQKGASRRQREQARQDLFEIHKRLRRQIGKPEIAQTAIMPVYTNIAQWV